MSRRAVWFVGMLIANITLVFFSITGVQAAQPITLSGYLNVTIGDDFSAKTSIAHYSLTTEDGRIFPLDITPDVLGQAGGVLRAGGQWVTVTLAPGTTRAASITVDDSRGRWFTVDPAPTTAWVTLPCKFSDISIEPRTTAEINEFFSGNANRIGAIFGAQSHGVHTFTNTTATSWATLGGTFADFQASPTQLESLYQNCIEVHGYTFGAHPENINILLNANPFNGGVAAYGGYYNSGMTIYRRTWLPPNGWMGCNIPAEPTNCGSSSIVAHEIGHAYGLPHSNNKDFDSDPYDNPWDVMSDAYFGAQIVDTTLGYGAKPSNTFHYWALGWLDPADVAVIPSGTAQTVLLADWGQTSTVNHFMALVPLDNPDPNIALEFLAIEVRKGSGNTGNTQEHLPDFDGVLIYDVNLGSDPAAYLVGAVVNDSNTFGYGEDAIFTLGESYWDGRGVQVDVLNTVDGDYQVRIAHDYVPPSPSISVGNASVTEGNSGTTTAYIPISLSEPSASPITVNFALIPVTATLGVDFTTPLGTSGTFEIPAGLTQYEFPLSITGDTLSEYHETIALVVYNTSSGGISDPLGQFTINDDEALVVIDVNDIEVTEPPNIGDTVNAPFTVSLSAASGRTVRVTYSANSSQGGATNGEDFGFTYGTLVFAPGETSKTVNVPIYGDDLEEQTEPFVLSLFSPVDGRFENFSQFGYANILDEDTPALVTVTFDGVTPTLENAGTYEFDFTLSIPNPEAATVYIDTIEGAPGQFSAIEGTDYVGQTNQALVIPAGATSFTVNVTLLDDNLSESTEHFGLQVTTNPLRLTGSGVNTELVGTILDNEVLPRASITGPTAYTETDADATLTYTVTLNTVSAQTVEVGVWFYNTDTAIYGFDYGLDVNIFPLVFDAGETVQTFDITYYGDDVEEEYEFFTFYIDSVFNAAVGEPSFVQTFITDDDAPISTQTELLVNGDFDTGTGGVVTPWVVKYKGTATKNDKRKCDTTTVSHSFSTPCSFFFKGNLKQNTTLSQTVIFPPGMFSDFDQIIFSATYRSNNINQTLTANFYVGTTIYAQYNLFMTNTGGTWQTLSEGPHTITNVNFSKVVVTTKSRATKGKLYLDDVSLIFVDNP